MGTRAHIAIKDADSYRVIYLHWDGYPDHALKTLKNHYNSTETVEELIGLGDLSSLEKSIETCVAYGRDRGEKNTESTTKYTERGLVRYSESIDYLYIFEPGSGWKTIS